MSIQPAQAGSGTGVSANFQYDAFGRRVMKTVVGTTQYLYDGVNPIEELTGATVTATTLAGLGVDEYFQRTDASGVSSYLTDALGSTIALTNGAGALGTQYTYEPFGNTTMTGSASANPFQFTSRENDSTGLYFYRTRYYSPTLQRFIGEDPGGLGAGVNLYGYTGNDPIDFIDPLGLDKKGPKSPSCTAAQQAAADLAKLLDSASTESGWLAFGTGVGTVLAGAGEGITIGVDTPVTLTFGTLTTFFTTTNLVTGASAAVLNPDFRYQ